MRFHKPAGAAAAALFLVSGQASAAETAIRLAPHRVVYDLSLVKGGGSKGVESARGRIAFDFLGDACEGYALKYRQVTVLESSESGARTSDLRTTTYEDGAGRAFRFKSESLQGGAATGVDGEAERGGEGALSIRLKKPKREALSFSADPVFPTSHMKRLIEAARRGDTTMEVKIFDGSDDGRKVYDTLAVIGRPLDPAANASMEAPSRQEALAKLVRWPVTLSYFAPGQGERTPIYTITFEMYENGISRALRLDYGDFAMRGDITTLEVLPQSACQR